MLYNQAGKLIQTTDSRGKTLSYTYDALGRKTAEYDAAATGQAGSNEVADWWYDNSNNKITNMTYPVGQLTTEDMYVGGTSGSVFTTQQKNFNIYGASLGETITIPSTSTTGTLAGTYSFSTPSPPPPACRSATPTPTPEACPRKPSATATPPHLTS
ncbi:RHS repeat domain-containing protein [Streptacidiphilus monticola]